MIIFKLIDKIRLTANAAAGVISLFGMASTASAQTALGPLYGWTQYDDSGGLSARAIIKNGATCPMLSIDGGDAIPMTLRRDNNGNTNPPTNFEAIQLCQMTVPRAATSIKMGSTNLPVHTPDPQTAIVIGDTGCRVASFDVQNCNEANQWTYPSIARESAKVDSDVILHVGDYHYREDCIFEMGCRWQNVDPETVGYKWAAWEADFFKPSVPLMAKAPFIFTRGNHEDCRRAYRGWYYLIAPSAVHQSCARNSPPYSVGFDKFQVMVMDTSDSRRLDETHFTGEFKTVFANAKAAGKPTWLMTHVPIMGIMGGRISDTTLINAAGSAGGFPQQIMANFAGHVHLFEKLSFTNGSPPQMVFGAGGTDRDRPLSRNGVPTRNALRVLTQLSADPAKFVTTHEFDFGVMRSNGDHWDVDIQLIDGSIAKSFSIAKDRALPPKP